MRQVQQASSSMPGVQLVSFTVDPEHDTPAVLAQYASRYQAQPDRWHFVTGPRETLDHLARDSFKLSNIDGSLNHSTRLVLLDRQSRIRGYYGTTEDNPVIQLVYDIKRVLGEKS
jgi:protein SCO1/2